MTPMLRTRRVRPGLRAALIAATALWPALTLSLTPPPPPAELSQNETSYQPRKTSMLNQLPPNAIPKTVLLTGFAEPLPEPIQLKAGPLEMVFLNGDLRMVQLGDRQLVQRIYAAVRDRNWGTVVPQVTVKQTDIGQDFFHIRFEVENKQPGVDFPWTGTIKGYKDGTVEFELDGTSRSEFESRRLGFCVLHPHDTMAGQPVVIEHVDGSVEESLFPEYIVPKQPFTDIRAIRFEAAPGVTAEIRLEGDDFEMEDQRNYLDTSFKTYSRPQRMPQPFPVEEGERIVQKITISLEGDTSGIESEPRPLTLTLDREAKRLPMARIGLGRTELGRPMTDKEAALLKALQLDHLRQDLNLQNRDFAEHLEAALLDSRALGVPLELGLMTSGDDGEIDAFAETLHKLEIQPNELAALFLMKNWGTVDKDQLARLRGAMALAAPGVPIGTGTRGYFMNLNSRQPDPEGLDLIAYAATPLVHSFDNLSMVEHAPGLRVTAESAQRFAGDAKVAVSSITMRPSSRRGGGEDPCDLPPDVDPRQMSLFGAAWTLSTLDAILEGPVDFATWFETIGLKGVIPGKDGTPCPEKFQAIADGAYPMYHVFADLGEFAGGEVIPVRTSHPVIADGFALLKDGKTRLLFANFSGASQSVTVEGLPAEIYSKVLDDRNALGAMADPAGYRETEAWPIKTQDGSLGITLRPYSVARFDFAME